MRTTGLSVKPDNNGIPADSPHTAAATRRRASMRWLAAVVMSIPAVASATHAPVADAMALRQKSAPLSIPFVPNAGQWDARTAFATRTFAGTLRVTSEGKLVYNLPSTTLTESFVSRSGQPLTATPRGFQPAQATVSSFTGSEVGQHRSHLHTYDRLALGEVFPGVNVQLRATGSNIEKIFTVAPHQDAAQIRIQLDGATALTLGEHGELVAATSEGPVTYTAPVAFQTLADGSTRDVAVSYSLSAATQT